MNTANNKYSRLRNAGFSLIELMIAMLVGTIVIAGLITVLTGVNATSRVQNGLARVQENARYALDRIAGDLRMTGAQHCANYDNVLPVNGWTSMRGIRLYNEGVMPYGIPRFSDLPVPVAGAPAILSPRFFIQGHECGANCDPLVTAFGAAPIPVAARTAGLTAGNRVRGTDVLTVRYLAGAGAQVIGTPLATGPITMASALPFGAGDIPMISDCAAAAVFQGAVAGTTVSITGPRNNIGTFSHLLDARVFNFSQDFRTVTYYLRLKDDPDEAGRVIPVLMRQQNGDSQELVEGVERLDFRYGVLDGNGNPLANTGNMRYLTAAQINAGSGFGCSPQPDSLTVPEPNCLWRMVRSIEVSMLVNTVDNVLPAATETYIYSLDGATHQLPGATMPQTNLPSGRMLRREYRTTVSLRAFNF